MVFNLSATSPFPLPDVPSNLTDPKERADYVVSHFWENADFNSSQLPDTTRIEQSFVDFLSVLPLVNDSVKKVAVENLFNLSDKTPNISALLADLSDKYLYSLDSPMKDEESYILFLDEIIKSSSIDNSLKLKPKMQLELVGKNRVGQLATDFEFELRDGTHTSLYKTLEGADILLLFYDPDCDHCKETIKLLTQLFDTAESNDKAKFKILAVYSGDNRNNWDMTKNLLPDYWLVGYDGGHVADEDIYVIRELPSIYLISKDKTVKLKDISPAFLPSLF